MQNAVRQLRHGLAVRETVLVVIVVGLLVAMFMPMLLQRQTTARRLACRERQRQLFLATGGFEELHRKYPDYRADFVTAIGDERAANGGSVVSWAGSLLPFLAPAKGSRQSPNDRVGQWLAADEQNRRKLESVYIPEFVCPTDGRIDEHTEKGLLSYVVNTGMPDAPPISNAPSDWPANGVILDGADLVPFHLQPNSLALIEARDGANQTFLLTENLDAGLWTDGLEPRVGFVWIDSYVQEEPARDTQKLLGINQLTGKGDGTYRFARPSSLHVRGVNVVYCSGKLQFLSQSIDYVVFANLMNSDITATMEPGSIQPLQPPYRLPDAGSATPTSPPPAPQPPRQ